MKEQWELNKNKRKEFYSWLNPYSLMIKDYPRRIFSFEDLEKKDILKFVIEEYKSIVLELGSGSGNHLIGQANLFKESAFFGVELRYKRAVRTIQKAEKLEADNVFILRTDAKNIDQYFAINSLQGIYVNFPDPWEKKKQRKNRLLNSEFLQQIYNLLSPGGFFSFKSDHREYFLSIAEILKKESSFVVKEYTEDLYQSEYLTANVKTEFEELFCSQNLPINYLMASKD